MIFRIVNFLRAVTMNDQRGANIFTFRIFVVTYRLGSIFRKFVRKRGVTLFEFGTFLLSGNAARGVPPFHKMVFVKFALDLDTFFLGIGVVITY